MSAMLNIAGEKQVVFKSSSLTLASDPLHGESLEVLNYSNETV